MNIDGKTPRQVAEVIVNALATDGESFTADWPALTDSITTACQHFSNEGLMRGRRWNHLADVAEFCNAMDVPIADKPAFPDTETMDLRVRLIAEEFCEWLEACGYGFQLEVDRALEADTDGADVQIVYASSVDAVNESRKDFAGAADALIDIEYVTLGAHLAFGVQAQPLWEAVQQANMAKRGGPVINNKQCKPPNWTPPDIAGELRKQGYKP